MKPNLHKSLGISRMPKSFLIFILYSVFSSSTLFAQFQNPGNGVIMYDNCEQAPQYSWGMDQTKGYAMITGGNQNMNNNDSRAYMVVSTDFARKGSRSYKMHVEKRTDYPPCCNWVRSEVMWLAPSQQTRANEWRFASVSILIPQSFQFENRPTQIGFDTKASPDDLQTPFWLGIMNGQYYVDGYFIGGPVYLGAVVKGQWEDWLLERNWSGGSDGFLRFYRNGKLVYEKYGANYFTRGGDAPIARMQHGLYKWVWATSNGQGWGEGSPVAAANAPMEIYLDEIRFGSPSAKLSDFLLDAAPAPNPNAAPTAQAGNNQTITLPTNTVNLTGSGADTDGTISGYTWTKVSGPSGGNIQAAGSASTQITGLAEGTYVFRLTVKDDDGATGYDEVTVTVNGAPQNTVPTVFAGDNITITLPTNTVTLRGSGTDPDGSISKFQWTKVSGPSGGDIQNAAQATTQVTGLLQGTYTYRLTVTDNNGATAQDQVTITVNAAAPPPNVAPTAQAGNNQTITLPASTVNLAGAGNDTDGSISRYAWSKVSGPTGGVIQAAGSASTQITGLIQGTYVFRLTVTDDGGATASDEVTITVNAAAPLPNVSPTAQAGSNLTITLPASTVNLAGVGNDTDGFISLYAWTKVSGPSGGTIMSAGSASTQITGLTEGTYVFRLTVTDNDGATATDDVTITVNPAAPLPNAAPTAIAGSNKTLTLPVNSTNLTGSGQDSDGSITKYAWTKVSGPAGGTIVSANAASTNITGLTQGTCVYRLTVTDNDGATASDDVTVTVNAATAPPPNNTPTVYAGDNITITLPVNAVTLTGTATDNDGRVATIEWVKVNGPAGETIAANDALLTRVSGLVAGTYTFRLTVTDDKGAIATDNVVVTVNPAAAPPPNAAPNANAGADKTITLPANSVNLVGSGQDTDGTIVDYTWSKVSGPTGGTIASADAASTEISGLTQGVYVYRLTVTDNDGAVTSDDVTITVNSAPAPPPNVAPQAVAGSNQVITLPKNSVTLNGSGNDSDGSITKYAWTKVSGPNSGNIATSNAASTSVTNLTAGTYVFRITVTDNDGATANDDVIVLVNPAPVVVPNVPPTASAGSDISIRLPVNTVTLNGSGADDDGRVTSYNWTKISGPSGGTFVSPSAQSTSFNGLVAGTYVVRLTVTDDDGATASDDVQVIVRPVATTPANQAPNANAGADIRIILPANSVTLNGNGTDVDGKVVSFNWTKSSGPAAGTIVNAAAQSTGVTGLVEGVYIFRLTVVDDDGAKATDDVKVTVRKANNAPANQAPTTSAGSDRVIQLPVSTVNLRGTAVDPDGTVVSYNWKKKSGPEAGTIQSAESIGTSVVDLKEGEYIYRFTAKDDKGAEGSSEIKVTVKAAAPAPVPNKMPVADAGADITLNLPVNSTTLNATKSTDPDGTIASYRWIMVKGPVTGTMTNNNLQIANLSDLVEGVYEFELTVFDNDGASATDRVLVTVIGKNVNPVPVLSDTITVYLPARNTQLDASKSYDSDGTIQSFFWKKVSGPGTPRLLSPNNAKTIITDLVMGTYQFSVTITDNDGTEATGTVTVIVKNSSARRLIPVINLYPNPAETQVTLTIDSEVDGRSDIVFYDLMGRPVLRDTFNKNSRTYQRKINISHLSDGVYAVEISIDQAEKVVRKVVKQ
ncbi:PKD domain-containing protein [Pollutibacter soli]|uniref:PKD domain-containing protein n=1 Tax=Pollutibacter soli TaxID=3034157 RepID=UPI003013EC12